MLAKQKYAFQEWVQMCPQGAAKPRPLMASGNKHSPLSKKAEAPEQPAATGADGGGGASSGFPSCYHLLIRWMEVKRGFLPMFLQGHFAKNKLITCQTPSTKQTFVCLISTHTATPHMALPASPTEGRKGP